MNEDLENYKRPTREEIRAGKLSDPKFLQSITEDEFEIIAILERLEDIMWIHGTVLVREGEKDVPMTGDTDRRTLAQGIEWWKSVFDMVEKEEWWKDGKHSGDCTRVPATCFRCMCESHLHTARRFTKWFNGPYNENTY